MKSKAHARLALGICLAFALSVSVNASVQYEIGEEVFQPLSRPLATGAKVKLHKIPVDGNFESLELERFDVFAPNADIKVLGANDEVLEQLAPPPLLLYRGAVSGDPDSLAFLSIDKGRIQGIVFKGDRRFGIDSRRRTHKQRTREGEGFDTFIQESDPIDDFPLDGKGFVCDIEGHESLKRPTRSSLRAEFEPQGNGSLSTGTARWMINMAIETDYELYVNVGSSTSNVNTFITNLIGAMSTIYSRDLTTEVVVSSLTINSSVSDPFTVVPGSAGTWNGSSVTYSTLHALLEFGDRWHNSPPSANPRSATALVSGKSQSAGIAWLDVLCSGDFFCTGGNCGIADANGHYGGRYSYNGGISPGNPPVVPDPDANAPTYTAPASNYWPLLQLSHETGHNVVSGHTHCKVLSAPDQVTYGRTYVDMCYGSEGGCYSGSVSVPTEKGTIMSYCHLNGGGTQTRFLFGKTGEASYVMVDELKAAIQAATPSLSAITAPSSMDAGESETASVTNVGGLTYEWTITNGVINSGQGTSSINFTANTNPTTVKIKATNSSGCSITDSKSITVNSVTYDPPTSVVATATSTTNVSITWSAPGGTAPERYNVYRSNNALAYSFVGFATHPTTTFTDTTASASTAYLYKVRSADSGGANESTDSSFDVATTVIFDDDPLVAMTTTVKASHFNQLATAINAVRTLAGLGNGTYTGGTLSGGGVTEILAAHVTDRRTAIDAARSSLGLSAISYGEAITAGTTLINDSHVNELRTGVK